MIIDDFLQQTATLKSKTGVNSYGEDVYAAGVTISVRWLYENKLIRGDDGEEVVSSAQISTKTEVNAQDLVTDEDGNDREVMMVRKNLDVDGVFSHYVARLK